MAHNELQGAMSRETTSKSMVKRHSIPIATNRYESIDVRKSHKLAPINSRPGKSFLDDSTYASSIARSKAILKEFNGSNTTTANNGGKSTANVSFKDDTTDHQYEDSKFASMNHFVL